MKVVFLEDVEGVALGGDVKNVKNGFARNYLLPKQLAVLATPDALQRIDRLKVRAEGERLKTLTDMRELAGLIAGKQVTVAMRAGASGRLYGSVTNAAVAEELSKLTDREIDRRTVVIDEPIRQVGVFEVDVRLHSEVDAKISLIVYPEGTDPMAVIEARDAAEAEAAEAEAKPDSDEGADEEPVQTEAAAETAVAEDEPSEEDATEDEPSDTDGDEADPSEESAEEPKEGE
jgi:large subunit ribosomal protein L9